MSPNINELNSPKEHTDKENKNKSRIHPSAVYKKQPQVQALPQSKALGKEFQ